MKNLQTASLCNITWNMSLSEVKKKEGEKCEEENENLLKCKKKLISSPYLFDLTYVFYEDKLKHYYYKTRIIEKATTTGIITCAEILDKYLYKYGQPLRTDNHWLVHSNGETWEEKLADNSGTIVMKWTKANENIVLYILSNMTGTKKYIDILISHSISFHWNDDVK